jgi:hypothetical protein
MLTRTPRTWTLILPIVVVAVAAAFSLVGVAHGGDESSEESLVRTLAVRAAIANGDRSPTEIAYVKSTRSAANLLLSHSRSTDPDVAVFVVQERGRFEAKHAHVPIGHRPLTGTVISLVVRVVDGQVLDFGLTQEYVDLSPLGQVHRLS